jgi:hypothetical protein
MRGHQVTSWIRFSLVATLLIAVSGNSWAKESKKTVYLFKSVSGPQEQSVVKSALPARWQDFECGSVGRQAILLTDPDSAWLGVVHGLQTIGVPFCITRDHVEALRHHVILVYPTISGRVLPFEALQALSKFPAQGGTLIGVNVEGGGMNELFGFSKVDSGRTRHQISFDTAHPLARAFDNPRERVIPFSDAKSGNSGMGSDGYVDAKEAIARFDDGTAAITSHRVGNGHAYAFGIDLGFFLLTGYNNREQGVARSYVNGYEPTLDVLLRLLRDMYREGEPSAVTLGTVPQGKELAALITHDIDYGASLKNSNEYAEFEASAGLQATYFIQTKYVRDWNDNVFFNKTAPAVLKHLRELGMEVASHSVAHSSVFNKLPLGSGDEHYPQYQPFVRDKEHTDDATILGELRISRFLLEYFLQDYRVVSFRPGHLRNPYTLPQALEATGYLYSSSVTANNSLTHLPFRLNYNRDIPAQSAIYEFPVTIEDEEQPRLGDRLPQALAVADRLARYGGTLVVLIHPNITDHKLQFEKGLVEALRQRAWFGTMREFGEFWTARDQVQVDVESQGAQVRVALAVPKRVSGLTLRLPEGYRVASTEPQVSFTQSAGYAVFGELSGNIGLILERN